MVYPPFSDLLLVGRIALIIGSTKGMGPATAKKCAYLNGATVIICSRSENRAKEVTRLNWMAKHILPILM